MFVLLTLVSLLGNVGNSPKTTHQTQQVAKTKITASSLLQKRVDIGKPSFPSLEEALRSLAQEANVRINLQLTRHLETSPLLINPYKLTKQVTTVEQILGDLKAIVPSLTWTASESEITVSLWPPKRANPLDVPIIIDITRNFTAVELISWMNRQSPEFPLLYAEDSNSFDSKQSCPLHVLPGSTRRDVLNNFANIMQLRWISEGPRSLGSTFMFASKIIKEEPD